MRGVKQWIEDHSELIATLFAIALVVAMAMLRSDTGRALEGSTWR